MLAAVAVGIGAVALWLGGVFSSGAQVTSDASTPVQPAAILETANLEGLDVGLREGNLAPDFEFSAFDGRRMKLSDFRGGAVLLNFWATWCIPCRAELPDMETLLHRYQDRGLAVIAVNNGESFAPADRFLRRLEVQLTAFAYDSRQSVVGRYDVYGMPMSYFIDARGVITRVVAGPLTPGIMETGVREALSPPRVN